ncbi:MAG: HAD hydrolase-like protein [Candidatus Bathyarchaeia archaeon]
MFNSKYRILDRDTLLMMNAVEKISGVTRITFDCDGVIVIDRDSYRATIINAVDYYFLELLKLKGNRGRLVTHDDIQRIKDTGAFNNDWNLTYMLIMYYIALLLNHLIKEVNFRDIEKTQTTSGLNETLKTLRMVGSAAARLGIDTTYLEMMKNDRTLGLDKLIGRIDGRSAISIPREIQLFFGLEDKVLKIAEYLCPFKMEGDDLLRRLFDEIYLGRTLYEKFTGRRAVFKFVKGLIDEERIIPTTQTLEKIEQRFGLSGIYSERPREEALYTLRKHRILRYFDEKAMFFNEDIIGEDPRRLGFGKPDPRSFLRFIDTSSMRNHAVAYVGDTVTDALLIKNVKALGVKDLVFIGTLSSSPNPEGLKSKFMELEADAIVYDVNNIPKMIEGLEI